MKKVEPKPEEKPADRTLIIEYSEWPSEAELELHVVRSCHHEVSCMVKQRDGIKFLKEYGDEGPSNEKTVNACIRKSRIREPYRFRYGLGLCGVMNKLLSSFPTGTRRTVAVFPYRHGWKPAPLPNSTVDRSHVLSKSAPLGVTNNEPFAKENSTCFVTACT